MNILSHFRLNRSEIKDFLVCWSLALVSRLVFVISWTVLIVLAIDVFDLTIIPRLFIVYGLLTIFGFFLFKNFVSSKNRTLLIIGMSFLCSLALILSSYFFLSNFWIFASLLLFTLAVFWSQMKISKLLFFESLFSPSQSTRIFPLIESAETIGTVLAGILISVFSTFFELSSLLALSSILVLMNLPILLIFNDRSVSVPAKVISHSHAKHSRVKFNDILNYSGLTYLAIIILFQFAFFYVLEFQFLDFVSQFADHGHDDHSMAFDLGFFHMIIGGMTLVYQFFLASRVMNFLGVIKSLLLSPIIMIFSLISMFTNPGFLSLLFVKTNHDISDVTFLNAYHATFYSFKHSSRSYVMEFLEGVVKPLGMIISSFLIIFILEFLNLDMFLNVVSLLMLGIVTFATTKFSKDYLRSPKKALLKSKKLSTKLNAISILHQNPSYIDFQFLIKYLVAHPHLDKDLQLEILELFKKYADLDYLDELLGLLEYNYIDDVRIFDVISHILKNNIDQLRARPFTLNKLLNQARDLSVNGRSKRVLAEIYLFQAMLSSDIAVIELNLRNLTEIMDLQLFKDTYELFKLVDDDNVISFVNSLNLDKRTVFYELADLHLYYKSSKFNSLIYKNLNSSEVEVQLEALVLALNYDLSAMFDSVERFSSVTAKLLFSTYVDKPIAFSLSDLDYSKMRMVLSRLENQSFKSHLVSILELSLNNEYADYDNDKDLLETLLKAYHMLSARKEYFMVKDLL